MSKITGNEPITALQHEGWPSRIENVVNEGTCLGLTIRQHFAAMAMQGLITSAKVSSFTPIECAIRSFQYADALINELNKQS